MKKTDETLNKHFPDQIDILNWSWDMSHSTSNGEKFTGEYVIGNGDGDSLTFDFENVPFPAMLLAAMAPVANAHPVREHISFSYQKVIWTALDNGTGELTAVTDGGDVVSLVILDEPTVHDLRAALIGNLTSDLTGDASLI